MAEDKTHSDETPEPKAPGGQDAEILSNTDRSSLEEIIARKRAELQERASASSPTEPTEQESPAPEEVFEPGDADSPEETEVQDTDSQDTDPQDPQASDMDEWAKQQLAAFELADSKKAEAESTEEESAAAEGEAPSEDGEGVSEHESEEAKAAAAEAWAAQQLAAFEEADRKKAEQQAKQASEREPVAGEKREQQEQGRDEEQDADAETPPTPASRPAVAEAPPRSSTNNTRPAEAAPRARRSRLVPLLLAANTLLVMGLVGVVGMQVFHRPVSSNASMSSPVTTMPAIEADPTPAPATQAAPRLAAVPEISESERLKAEAAYTEGRYRSALALFEPLYRRAVGRPADDLLRDLLALRVAGCLRQLGEIEDARGLLVATVDSRSPLLAAVAGRDLAAVDGEEGRLLVARTRAYAALGLLGAVEHSTDALAADCEYIIARSLSEMVLTFVGESSDVDWSAAVACDPFAGHEGADLRRLLGDGVSRLGQARLSPGVSRPEPGTGGVGWNVAWSGPTLQDLLQQLAGKSGMDIRWDSGETQARYREVTLISQGTPEHTVAAMACGMSGLLARLTGSEITVYDPRPSESTQIRRDLVGREAVSLWRRFFLRTTVDDRVAEGHYILGRVHEAENEPLEALRAYQLISGRHWRHKIAANALLRSARLRIALRDHRGAGKDLVELLDRYPDSPLIGEAYLSWGEATRQSGRREEAARIYQKLYYFENVARSLRSRACLESAQCLYDEADYAGSAKWATRALGFMKNEQGPQIARAYLLLAESASSAGDLDEAALAFQQVLGVEPGYKQRINALLGLVPVQIRRERFVHAVGTLERLRAEDLNESDKARWLELNSELYRAMGLPHRAVTILRNEIVFIESPKLRAGLRAELARAEAQTDRLDSARESLTLFLAKAEPGQSAYAAQCDLAEVSLRLGDTAEAISIADHLVRSDCDDAVRFRAARVLGTAYVRGGEYEKAAEALSLLATTSKVEVEDE
jgi:tetratricopeptide (TPR) repeat protein